MVLDLSNGDQGWQCVADDWKMQSGKPLRRKRRQFEGKVRDALPGLAAFAEATSDRTHGQDGNGEGLVLSVALSNRL